MSIVPFLLEGVLASILTVIVIGTYVSFRKTAKFIYFSSWLGWFFSFFIFFLLPLDVTLALYKSCQNCKEPFNSVSTELLQVVWNVIYWSSFAGTWVVYPLLQGYVMNGHFSAWEKLKSSIRDNLIFYGIVGILSGVIFVLIVITNHNNLSKTYVTLMVLSNVWGLFMLICMLGIGLVEVPRRLWRRGDIPMMLRYHYWSVEGLLEEKDKAQLNLEKTLQLIKKTADEIRPEDPHRKYINMIVKSCPPAYDQITAGDGVVKNTYKDLVSLNYKLITAVQDFNRNTCLYDELLKKTFALQDIKAARGSVVKYHINWSFKRPRSHRFSKILDLFDWIWNTKLYSTFLRIFAVLCAGLSLMVVWNEVIFAFWPEASVFHQILRIKNNSTFFSQVLVLIPVSYMGTCAYSSLFRLKIFNFYRLIPHQQTDSNSILFSASYLCRLGMPLAINFVMMSNLEKELEDSPLLKVVGQMDVVPVLGTQFFIYFPLFLLVLCFATIFNLFTKIVNCVSWFGQRFQYDEYVDEERVKQGKLIVQREREARKRDPDHPKQVHIVQNLSVSPSSERLPELKPLEKLPPSNIEEQSPRSRASVGGRFVGFLSRLVNRRPPPTFDHDRLLERNEIDLEPTREVSQVSIQNSNGNSDAPSFLESLSSGRVKYEWESDEEDDDDLFPVRSKK